MKAEQIYVPDNLLNEFTDKQIKKHGRHFIAVELPDDIKRGNFVFETEYSSVFRHYKKNEKLANKIFV